ncbi:hypothetical protein [Streptomyces sp. 8N616]|uniref:hypothetical protein n=1 Tax=Streptomyces sp. 8N616 TaxID=3457414 RepID=UPI003FCFBF82
MNLTLRQGNDRPSPLTPARTRWAASAPTGRRLPTPGHPPAPSAVEQPALTMPPEFQAFCSLHQPIYLDYAQIHLEDAAAAADAVRKAFGDLAMTWPRILRCPNSTAHAWQTFTTRISPTRHQLLRLLYAEDSTNVPLAVRRAVLTITAAQHNILTLHCVLHYPLRDVATTVGQETGMVRSLLHSALRCLPASLEP